MTIKEFINEAPFGCSFTDMMEFLEENEFSFDYPEDDQFPTAIEICFEGFDEEFDETADGNITASVHVFLNDSVINTIAYADDADDEDATEEAEELEEEILDLASNELWDDLNDYVETYCLIIRGDGDLEVDIDWKQSGISDKEFSRLADRY